MHKWALLAFEAITEQQGIIASLESKVNSQQENINGIWETIQQLKPKIGKIEKIADLKSV